ncbi:MAG TPA: DUF2723 domain-containing protein, partial [Verrucomicrobia bacterium]|nr:DUF2723 domain-containing protein [Verrucomicrobiota bacterium]
MDDSTKISINFTHKKLPWVIGGLALAIYFITLNRWVSLTGLQWMTQASNWDLWPSAHAPLDYLLTRVVGILPESGRILVYNGLTAVFGSLVLIQLARSIALLPHDRTREQRSRQRNEFAFLTIKWCWIPPIIACTACALQITFWEHSVSATGEMLNLLLFAYSIRCLLEYRILHQESWLYRMAFVYGLAITSNYAMIGFFPCFLIALIWIKGTSFFNFNFMLRMIGIGTTGLLAYLIVPIALHWFGNAPGTFWQVMATYLGSQKSALLGFPRYLTLIASLTAILPILLIGIRWPSSFGDTSAAGTAITQVMYHVLHGLFLTACLLVAFDPTLGGNGFSPRALTQGLVPFLTFYYLGALCTGYFIGYFLLVFSKPPGKSKRRPGPLHELGAKIMPTFMLLLLLAVPAGLLARNFAHIQADNVPVLQEYAEEFAALLPESNNIILSDDPTTLRLLQAALNSQSKEKADQNILISSWLMESPIYHGLIKERFPNRWMIELGAKNEALANLDRGLLPGILKHLRKNNRIFYMNPSFGYYFEFFYLKPKGVLYELTLLPDGENSAPHLTEEEIDENHAFWKSKKDTFDSIKRLNEMDRSNGQT